MLMQAASTVRSVAGGERGHRATLGPPDTSTYMKAGYIVTGVIFFAYIALHAAPRRVGAPHRRDGVARGRHARRGQG